MELCPRWAVPKASEQYTSANFAMEARKALVLSLSAFTLFPAASTPLPSSSTWYRQFSRRMIEPGAGSAHAISTSGPAQSLKNVTGLPSLASRHFATGASENFGTAWPSGRPKCEQSTTDLQPLPRQYWMVGSAASIRCVFVMTLGSFLSCGTLKSTRMKTRLPATSTASIRNLFSAMAAPKRGARRLLRVAGGAPGRRGGVCGQAPEA
mmetsp:Transcript_81183/g.248053  ORF Transcript_81183/g.248053 Transcript_81183/m.248053 type:complete len:209 (+) Transcript_81183:1397-2023(+)